MKNKFAFLAIALASFCISPAFASTTHLSEFNWDDPSGKGKNGKDQSSADDGRSCAEKCEGYKVFITECEEGFDLVSCEESGCFEYHKCEPNGCNPGYNTEFKDCAIEVQEDNYLCSKCIE